MSVPVSVLPFLSPRVWFLGLGLLLGFLDPTQHCRVPTKLALALALATLAMALATLATLVTDLDILN